MFHQKTSAEEINSLKEDLVKVLKRGEREALEVEKVSSILKVLQTKQMSVEILKETLVGKTISLTKLKVAKLAGDPVGRECDELA